MSKAVSQLSDATFGSLLRELQQIWVESGESDSEIDTALLELEQECLQVYRRKVEQENQNRLRLHQCVAEKEAELAALYVVLGERLVHPSELPDKKTTSLKAQLSVIIPQLEEFRSKKEERKKQFLEVRSQIRKLSSEITGDPSELGVELLSSDEEDLSLGRLDDYRAQLQALQREKSERLHKVLDCVNTLHGLCSVLGMDFAKMINDVHPSLNKSSGFQVKSISDDTLERLSNTVQMLTEEKEKRTKMLQTSLVTLMELWKLLDTPLREQKSFHHMIHQGSLTSAPGRLSLEAMEQVKIEVQKLEKLKASKMKELILKRSLVLEDVCRQGHMEANPSTSSGKTNALIDSGMLDASELLLDIEGQIIRAHEEVESRKEILDRVEKWLGACEEERWLEDYNMDENRYSATKGAHLNLKRAEKARIMVAKLPSLVDGLIAKIRSWEEEKGMCFLFDGLRLLSMLEDYNFNRHEREDEKQRIRDQKRMQDLFLIEKEALYGSRGSPTKGTFPGAKRGVRSSTSSMSCTPRRSSSTRATTPTPTRTPESTPHSNGHKYHTPFCRSRSNNALRSVPSLNIVHAMHRDDAMSVISGGGSDSSSHVGSSACA